ncbi:DUF3899 domain-containing protein [Mycoplasma seminis]|uniref:DUF3899 domain-containing protein n=2 Tax=Mycoplasma seminis TaxID=512749 RepID=A0ABY9HB62_9MOLU|nr:DUF3899 domain-containing protein [Mycoplasma seminis]WLP85837.1 DUF3899 domain-containing protein [Mycoplasma seminis]
MNNFWFKTSQKFKIEFSSLRFYLINLVFLLIYFAIVLAYYLVKKNIWYEPKYHHNLILNAFSVPAFVCFLLEVMCLVFKFGFMEKTFAKFKMSIDNFNDAKEQRQLKKMPNEDKRAYLKKKEELAEKQKQQELKRNKSKFPFGFGMFLYGIASIAFIIVIYI